MLSKIDIQNEIGKNINIFPLTLSNIKENSINLCASSHAWTLSGGKVFMADSFSDNYQLFSLNKTDIYTEQIIINSHQSAVVNVSEKEKYIMLFPHSTTLIETEEVLSVGNNIGGTYHSKVGLVSQGIGHIGTMVGPNFSGESLVALHNISDNLVTIRCGESFVSVVFHYLDTSYKKENPTVSGHTDKFSTLGINLSPKEDQELNADWKKQHNEVKRKLVESNEYKELQKIISEQKKKKYLNKKTIVAMIIMLFILVFFGAFTHWVDSKNGNTIWSDRFWNVCLSGAFVSVFSVVIKHILNE